MGAFKELMIEQDQLNYCVEFLRENQSSEFFVSLLNQYEVKGYLSEKQIACVEKAIAKTAPVKFFSIPVGQNFEIKTWLAKRLQAQLSMAFFLRNLEVTEVLNETPKAYEVKVNFVSKIACNCHVCGRALDNEISKATGIGPTCAAKIGLSRPNISDAHKTIQELEDLCRQIGTIGPIWIPKSQIKKAA